jgi:hypothetical protein
MPKKSASEKHKPLPNGDFGQIMKNSRSSSGILPLFSRMRQDAAPTCREPSVGAMGVMD